MRRARQLDAENQVDWQTTAQTDETNSKKKTIKGILPSNQDANIYSFILVATIYKVLQF